MSPLQIEILLQLYYSPRGYTGEAKGSPSYKAAMEEFERRGLLVVNESRFYALTEKGMGCIDRLRAVPMEVEAS